MELIKVTDVAVVEFSYGDSEWMTWAYIGPERKSESTHPEMVDGITDVRIRYLDDRDDE